MSAQSGDPLISLRPIAPVSADLDKVPGEILPPASPEQAQAVTAVFARQPAEEKAASIIGFAAAGMLLHDIVSDTLAPSAEPDEEDEKKKKPSPPSE
jgi:hypothetical protein